VCEILKIVYTLYICKSNLNKREIKIMAVANLKKIDKQLQDMYKDQVTTTAASTQPFVDRSDLLFEQMNFIAAYNKQMLHIA